MIYRVIQDLWSVISKNLSLIQIQRMTPNVKLSCRVEGAFTPRNSHAMTIDDVVFFTLSTVSQG